MQGTTPETQTGRFLTAEWLNLVMLSYPVDPDVLTAHVPAGCELDTWRGQTLVSMVGFQFFRTRVLGLPIPFHCNFEEVNLRFYVRRKADDGWRRGVVFIKELVPRSAIAFVARHAYGENYEAYPMRHAVDTDRPSGETTVTYEWRRHDGWEGLSAQIAGPAALPADASQETFITEHYWGYARQRKGATVEYRVEHPRWRVWRAESSWFRCDVASLYGDAFVDPLSAAPCSAFVADGSPIIVRRGRRLEP